MKCKSSLFLLISKISACFFLVFHCFFCLPACFPLIFTDKQKLFTQKTNKKKAMAYPPIPTDMPSQMNEYAQYLSIRCLHASRTHWARQRGYL